MMDNLNNTFYCLVNPTEMLQAIQMKV